MIRTVPGNAYRIRCPLCGIKTEKQIGSNKEISLYVSKRLNVSALVSSCDTHHVEYIQM